MTYIMEGSIHYKLFTSILDMRIHDSVRILPLLSNHYYLWGIIPGFGGFTLTHEFSSKRTFNKVMNCLLNCNEANQLPMILHPDELGQF